MSVSLFSAIATVTRIREMKRETTKSLRCTEEDYAREDVRLEDDDEEAGGVS